MRKEMGNDFVNLGERTYYKIEQHSLQVIQKMRVADLAVTMLSAVLFYKIWFVSIPLIVIALSGFFVMKRFSFDKDSNVLQKQICFLRYEIFKSYTLSPLTECNLVDYKSEIHREQDKRSDSFDIIITKSEAQHRIVSFQRSSTREKLFSVLREFLYLND
jgi:hypothetical protein